MPTIAPVAAVASVPAAATAKAATRAPVASDDDGDDFAAGTSPAPDSGAGRRERLREPDRRQVVALVVAVVFLLGVLPLSFAIRAAVRDPLLSSLDALEVPAWAATDVRDATSGSRWCFIACPFLERTARSGRSPDETAQVYERALAGAGWQRWNVGLCPDQPEPLGHYTCWRRDEMTLDLWVREPTCTSDTSAGQSPAGPGGGSPDAVPARSCAGTSSVSVKVRTAIDDDRTRPQPSLDPDLTGEDPDPVVTDDPLQDPTPSPS